MSRSVSSSKAVAAEIQTMGGMVTNSVMDSMDSAFTGDDHSGSAVDLSGSAVASSAIIEPEKAKKSDSKGVSKTRSSRW